ncbi:ABC transporter permease [Siminovitchia fortis]|uniref:ABC transporter permease n=1 Tax=Siminovitchia fortis TaxID=254758 RepID=UPI001643542B|nr:ABC transporter permease [Siminovitchia fortis]
MSSIRLLFHRIRENWNYKYKIIKTVMDWTVLVYLVIPAAVVTVFIYRSWWIEPPAWIASVPFPLLFAIYFFLLWGGYFKTFVREADIIFLRKNEKLMLGMKQGGIIVSYLAEILSAALLAVLISPLWMIHYGLSMRHLILFFGLWVSLKWLIMAVNGKLNVHVKGWRSLARSIPVVIGAGIIWRVSYNTLQSGSLLPVFIIIIFNAAASMLLLKKRFTSIHTFEQDLSIDEKDKNKYTEMIFAMSMDVEKLPKPKPVRKTPRLYSKSNRIFKNRTPKNGFLELFIKAATRDTEYIRGYLQILGVTAAAIVFAPPIWLKITIAAAGFFFLIVWIGSVWHKLIGSHPFTKKYSGEEGYIKGKNLVTTVLSIPFVIMCLCNVWILQWIRSLFPFF